MDRTRAQLVAVGDELVRGDLVDTNSPWVAARLAELGVDVVGHVTVGDDVDAIAGAVAAAARSAEVVVVTGGLGPTQDDVTRPAVGRLLGVWLERHGALVDHVRDFAARSGRQVAEIDLGQADLPAGARVLAPVGTAAGFAVHAHGAVVYCIPGVPAEMHRMVERDVLPEISERSGLRVALTRVVRTTGMGESAVAERAQPVLERLVDAAEDGSPNPAVAFLASRGETTVRVTGRARTREEARTLVDPFVDELVDRLGTGVAGVDDEGVEEAVARQLAAFGWTLAVGESVSGGGLGARLVRVPGASRWFRGGIVAYATELKSELGGVDPGLLSEAGPVSETVAGAFAEAVRGRLHADCGLAVTGVAGPDPQGGEPVGTVCLGVAVPPGASGAAATVTRTVRLPGRDRVQVQDWAASVALDALRRRLAELGPAELGSDSPSG